MKRKVREQRRFLNAWEQKTMLPLAFASIIYMTSYTVEVLWAKDALIFKIADTTSSILWGIFAADVFMRFFNRISVKDFFRTTWIELVALILPALRFLRILRLLIPIKALGNVAADRMKVLGIYTVTLMPVMCFMGAIAMIDAEDSHPDSKLTNLKAALWWSFTTITGTGDPDGQPVTDNGRIVTLFLVLSGITLVSVGAGLFASWIMGEGKAKS
ncbi:MAG: ion transporter [Micrococcales bacterium]